MTWVSMATDGYAVGNLSFLGDYEISSGYKILEMMIKRSPHDTEWDQYDLHDDSSQTTIHLRTSLRPAIDNMLNVSQGDKLESKVVNVYCQKRKIVGFVPKEII
jgi:hypothetical protein